MNYVKLTRVLLEEVGLLLNEVSEFVRTCCYHHHLPIQEIEHNVEDCLELHEFLALGILGEKEAKVRLNDFTTFPSKYQEVFAHFKNKEIVQVDYIFQISFQEKLDSKLLYQFFRIMTLT